MGFMFNPLILDFLLSAVSFFFFFSSFPCCFGLPLSGILSTAGLILIKHLASCVIHLVKN